jgi:endoglucanase
MAGSRHQSPPIEARDESGQTSSGDRGSAPLRTVGIRTTDQSTRDATYTAWTNAVRTGGGDGCNVWLLTAKDDSNGCTPFSSCPLYPDFDGYRVTTPSATATVLATAAAQIATGGGDTTAPTNPGTPVASTITTTGATLTWTASTDAGSSGLAGYNAYRRVGTTDTLLTIATTNTVALTGLTAGTSYTVVVRARDGAGNLSAASSPVTFSPTGGGDTTAPTTPAGVTVSAVTQISAPLSWSASTDNVGVTGYDVLLTRGTTTTTSSVTGTPPATTLALTGLTAGTAYSVVVQARDAAGNQSARSASVPFTTTGTTPPPPGGCVVTYRNINQWPGGFQGDVTITNNGTSAVNGWQLKWTFANGQTITQIWGAVSPVPGGVNVTATNASWNPGIPANGGIVNFGFLANWTGTNSNPSAFTLNGTACTVG